MGWTKPVHPSTYYRGVRAVIYSQPDHVAPGVSRVDLDKLAKDVQAFAQSFKAGAAA